MLQHLQQGPRYVAQPATRTEVCVTPVHISTHTHTPFLTPVALPLPVPLPAVSAGDSVAALHGARVGSPSAPAFASSHPRLIRSNASGCSDHVAGRNGRGTFGATAAAGTAAPPAAALVAAASFAAFPALPDPESGPPVTSACACASAMRVSCLASLWGKS